MNQVTTTLRLFGMNVPSCPLLLALVVLTTPASAVEEQRSAAPPLATTTASKPSEQAKIQEALDTLVKKCQEKGHWPGHGFPVLQVAQEVLKLRDSIPEIRDADPLLVQIAALLHDIGGGGEANSRPGAAIAREILTELNYDPGIVKKVARIVETHHLTGNIVPGVDDAAEWYVVLVADTPKVIKIVGPSADYPAADKRRFDQDQFAREVKERVAELKRIISKGQANVEEGFVSLFDSKTLEGWAIRCKPQDRELAARFWRVDGGAILADSLGHTEHDYVWLVTKQEYGDFILRLRFQVEQGIKGNSGIQIRSRWDDQAGYLDGPQIDINPPGPWRTGMIWDETRGAQGWLYPKVPRGKWVDPSMAPTKLKFLHADEAGGWNDLEIVAQGMTVTARLNGILVTDYDGAGVLDDEVHRQRNVGRRGVIALQIHTHDPLKIRFKDVRLKSSSGGQETGMGAAPSRP